MSVKNYDPAQVDVIVAGILIEGYAAGTFVTVSRNSDTWKLKKGADGEGARAKSNDKSGLVVVEAQLKQKLP